MLSRIFNEITGIPVDEVSDWFPGCLFLGVVLPFCVELEYAVLCFVFENFLHNELMLSCLTPVVPDDLGVGQRDPACTVHRAKKLFHIGDVACESPHAGPDDPTDVTKPFPQFPGTSIYRMGGVAFVWGVSIPNPVADLVGGGGLLFVRSGLSRVFLAFLVARVEPC